MSELKPCPFCGRKPYERGGYVSCHTEECLANADYHEPAIGSIEDWNTRPIEDALNKRIAELEGFTNQLIEAGDGLVDALDPNCETEESAVWNERVFDWKEG